MSTVPKIVSLIVSLICSGATLSVIVSFTDPASDPLFSSKDFNSDTEEFKMIWAPSKDSIFDLGITKTWSCNTPFSTIIESSLSPIIFPQASLSDVNTPFLTLLLQNN